MKRKLSLGMAIVTKPKVIILDEPTSGLDVESRRQIWDLIHKIKKDRSIIMSSQHLEEADELADRIMIMTKGSILTVDKPDGIKVKFGIGYKLLIEPRPGEITKEELDQLKTSALDEIICGGENARNGIVENQDSTSRKLIYQVPFPEVETLQKILERLEGEYGSKLYIDVETNSLEDAYI